MTIEHQVAEILARKFNPNPNPNMKIGLDVHVYHEFPLEPDDTHGKDKGNVTFGGNNATELGNSNKVQ